MILEKNSNKLKTVVNQILKKIVFGKKLFLVLFAIFVFFQFYFGYIDFIGGFSLSIPIIIIMNTIYIMNFLCSKKYWISMIHITISVFLLFISILIFSKDISLSSFIKISFFPIVIIYAINGAMQTVRDIRKMLFIVVLVVAFSCLIAFFQAFDIDFFWNLRLKIGMPEELVIRQQLLERMRAPGLAYFSVQLSYQIVCVFPFVLFLYSTSKRGRGILLMMCILLLLGAISIKSITAFLSCIVSALMYFVLTGKFHWKYFLFIFVVLIPILVFFLINTGLYERLIKLDGSALSRIPFFLIGLMIVIDNPFGVPFSQIENLKYKYLGFGFVRNIRGANFILDTSFHNSFINISVILGVIGGVAYFLLFLLLFIYFCKRRNYYKNVESVFCFYSSAIIFLIVLFFQSSTHNAGLSSGDVFCWLSLALILSYDYYLSVSKYV
jgi:O-antigen ligase